MKLRTSLLLGGLAQGVPAAAQACGVCVDAWILEWSWWATGLHFLTGVLFIELVVYGVASRLLKQPQHGRARWLLLGLLSAFVLAGLSGGSGSAASLGFGTGLAIRFGLSVRDGLRVRPRLAWARVGTVAALVGLVVFAARPAARPTSWLVGHLDGSLHRKSAAAHLIPTSWSERELSSRRDASAALVSRLSRFEPDPPEYHGDRSRILRLLRAHTMAGGDGEMRHGECRRLGVDASWGALMQSPHATRVCGFQLEPIAAIDLR